MIDAIFEDGNETVSCPVVNPGICNGNAVALRFNNLFGGAEYWAIEVDEGDDPAEKFSETSEGTFLLVPDDVLGHWSNAGRPEWHEINSKGQAYRVPKNLSVLATKIWYNVPGHGLIEPAWLESPEVYEGEKYTVNPHA